MELEYRYRELFGLCDKSKLGSVKKNIADLYENNLAKKWSIELNSEWICRHYLATKMILNATALLHALDFSKENGMRLANSYFEYYAVLSLARAVTYTLPDSIWDDGALITISHKKAINLAFGWLERFNVDKSKSLHDITLKLKAQREIIAYRIPLSADENLNTDHDIVELLTILAEIAQFNSELLDQAITKFADKTTFVFTDTPAEKIVRVQIEGLDIYDHEDAYRLSRLSRWSCRPMPLQFTMTEGMIEDFFGAWENDDGIFTCGSPCDWQLIFDIP